MKENVKSVTENLTKEEILQRLFEKWQPQVQTEIIPAVESYGRIPAEDQTVQYNLPVVRAASMDGIAVDSRRFAGGLPDTSSWRSGVDYVRADTGDDFDDAFDSVIRIEDIDLHKDGSVSIHLPEETPFQRGMNVRSAGSTMRKGETIVSAGQTITALDLASLLSGGITELAVIKKPIVGFIPTGSELIPPGTPPQRGQNIESNAILASHLISEIGGEPLCYPIAKDVKHELREVLRQALDECDIVIINGGSSKGREDYNTKIISEYGEMISHWVKAAPGRPFGMAIAENRPLINLSGPPAAAFYGLEWCLRPVIARAMNLPERQRPVISVFLTEDIHAPGAIEFLCMLNLTKNEDGTWNASRTNARNSGKPPLSGDAMLVTRLGVTLYRAGQTVDVELLRPLEDIR